MSLEISFKQHYQQFKNTTRSTAPTGPQERIVEIDILRGVAVVGMILWDFRSRAMGNYYVDGKIDHLVNRVIGVFDIENTIHLLFSFLFGMGLAMQIRSHAKPFEAICLRRLLALFIIGMMNGFFLDRSDILYIYAMLGVVLLLFANLSNRAILTSAVLLIAGHGLGILISTRFMSYASYSGAGSYDSLRADNVLFSPFSDLVLMRAKELVRQYAHPRIYIENLDILAMFLFGLYTVRRGLFQNIPAKVGFIRKIMLFSLAVYLAGLGWIFALNHAYVSDQVGSWFFTTYRLLSLNGRPEAVQLLVRPYTIQALSLFYICLIVLLLQSDMFKRICLPLANVGRLALSNYLSHDLIGTILFFGYGLALYGKLGIARGEALALLVCGFQIIISSWWLRKFQFGPVEWLWRSITYWKTQPFRVPIA